MKRRDFFDEVADLMAASLSVGPYATREEIITKLRAKFKTEKKLRAAFAKLKAEAERATADPNVVLLIPVKDHPGEFHVVRNEPKKH